jgi:hypothetical protein
MTDLEIARYHLDQQKCFYCHNIFLQKTMIQIRPNVINSNWVCPDCLKKHHECSENKG